MKPLLEVFRCDNRFRRNTGNSPGAPIVDHMFDRWSAMKSLIHPPVGNGSGRQNGGRKAVEGGTDPSPTDFSHPRSRQGCRRCIVAWVYQ